MANGVKTYQIKINGIDTSIDAVKSLEKELFNLESRINALGKQTVNVKSSGGGGGTSTSSKSALSEEEKLAKQIEQIDAKREVYSKEIYQNYLAAKEVLNETVKDQKQLAASERLQAGSYSNTMKGMKQELADIKEVMQTVDLGDTDQFDKLTQRANKLNDELKKIEESYGQFGRNVGNYKEALNGISVVIAGQTREFSNSKQALRSLKQELDSLSASERGNSSYAKELRREYNRLKSAIDDATKSSKFMDNALDMMQSFTSLGQISQGFSTFFGLDNSDLERQIAKLVALQNMLQGLEKINKQIDSEEGIGKWLAKGSQGVDAFVTRLTGAQKRMGLFIGETKKASVAINVFSKALKGIGAVGIAGGVLLLTNVIGDLIDKFSTMFKDEREVGESSKYLESELNTLKNTVERLENENLSAWLQNISTDTAYLKNNLELLTRSLVDVIGKMEILEDFKPSGMLEKINTKDINEVKKVYKELLDDLNKLERPGFSFKKLFADTGAMRETIGDAGDAIINDFLNRAKVTIEKAREEVLKTGNVAKDTAEKIKDLNREVNEDFVTNSALANVKDFSSKGSYYAMQVDFVTEALKRLNQATNTETLSADYLAQLQVDQLKGSAKIKAQNALDRKKEIANANGNPAVVSQINKKYDIALQESLKSINQAYQAALNDLNNLRIQNMRDGLKKELAQLEQEKKEKIQAIVTSEYLVAKRTEEVKKLYRQKELDAQRDWAYETLRIYQDLYGNIQNINQDIMSTEVSTSTQNVQNRQFTNQQTAWQSNYDTNDLKDRETYYAKLFSIEEKGINRITQIKQEELDKQIEFDKREEEVRHERVANAKTTALVMEQLASYEKENGVPLVPDSADADWNKFEKSLQDNLRNMKGELVDAYNSGKLEFKNFVTLIEEEQDAHNAKMNALEKKYVSDSEKNTNDNLQERQEAYNKFYQNIIALVRTEQDKISESMQMQPVNDNDWDVVQVNKTKENYRNLLKATDETIKKIAEIKKQLKKDLDSKKITAEDFFMRDSELDAAEKAAEQTTKDIKEKQKNLVADFVQSIEKYLNAAMDSFSNIMNAVWDAQDNANDKEADRLDKLNEIIEKKLDEQEEIINQHKDRVNSIEDELQTARGDRRQHLIDQLNAEIAAERAAQKEKEKAAKQKEAIERQQDALEEKRKKQQYHRDMLQAVVNGAMAVTYALVNKWPIPAIPMAALAASTAAAQIAIMASNKPYAKGGLLEGPSHKEGGIPVGNTGIEVEGNEYVIRKKSTAPNIEILDYINKSERKLNLDDFIDFYSSGKLKKNIVQMSPRSRFADGGALPVISNNYGFDDRLLTAFEDYSNRPVVVTVKDINDRQEAVRNVQVLAGLTA